MSGVLGDREDDPLYQDAKTTITFTPDSDLSSANAIRAYLVEDGNRVQFGSDSSGVSSGTEVTAEATPLDLSISGNQVTAERYVLQWVYEDSDGEENTLEERLIQFTAAADE